MAEPLTAARGTAGWGALHLGVQHSTPRSILPRESRDSQPLAQPQGPSPRDAGELTDHGLGAPRCGAVLGGSSTQLSVPTAPVYQPRVAQTKARSPGKNLPGQSQPSPRDLASAQDLAPQRKETCRAVRFSTPLRASSVSRQARLKEESLFYLQQTLNHAPSRRPPRPFLALLFMQTPMPPFLLLSQQRRCCSSSGCAGGDGGRREPPGGARRGHVTNLTSQSPQARREQEPRSRHGELAGVGGGLLN